MIPIRQPVGSSLCGQCCIAMVAGVSLSRASQAVNEARGYKVGIRGGGTYTRDIIAALRLLDVTCASKLRRVSRVQPVYPRRAILAIVSYVRRPEGSPKKIRLCHWMLIWDGTIYDPAGLWPEFYKGWTITTYLDLTQDGRDDVAGQA